MKTRKKGAKLFAVLMSIMMIFTMMPAMAFATEAGQSILELCATEGCEYAAGHEGNCSNYVASPEACVTEGCEYLAGHEGNCSNYVAPAEACVTEGCEYLAGHEGNCSNYVAPAEACATEGCEYAAGHEGNCSNFVDSENTPAILSSDSEGENQNGGDTKVENETFFISVDHAAGHKYEIERINENVYYCLDHNGTGGLGVRNVKITVKVPEDKKIEALYCGKNHSFDLSIDGALTTDDDGNTVIDVKKANVGPYRSSNEFLYHSFSGCYYVTLDDGSIYTLIFDSGKNISNQNISLNLKWVVAPQYVGLYDVDNGLPVEGAEITNLTNTKRGGTVTHCTITSSDELRVRLSYLNSDLSDIESIKKSSQYDITQAGESWLMVNGERTNSFAPREGGMSPALSLKPGINVVEVFTDTSGFVTYDGAGTEWYSKQKSTDTKQNIGRTVGVVYLIDYQCEEPIKVSAAGNNTELKMDGVRLYAFNNGNGVERAWKLSENTITFSLPIGLKDADKTFSNGLFLYLPTEDPQAIVEIIDDTQDGSLVSGKAIGDLHAINPGAIVDDEFVIRVTAADGTTTSDYTCKVNYADNNTEMNLTGIDGGILNEEFSTTQTSYLLKYTGEIATLTCSVPDGATISLDGSVTTGSLILSKNVDYHTVTVTAADGITKTDYYFITQNSDGTVPYFTISEDTKTQAAHMLKSFWDKNDNQITFNDYWAIFQAAAAGDGFDADGNIIPTDFNDKYVYNIANHPDRQATDPAACILQAVILGENPYNFDPDGDGQGINFVERLKGWSAGGGYANNIWYVMAAKAVGIDPLFTSDMMEHAISKGYDLDMRSWAIASLVGLDGIEQINMVPYIESLHNVQSTPDNPITDSEYYGLWKMSAYYSTSNFNTYTLGCVLSAIASAGVDPDRVFAYDDNGTRVEPMDVLQSQIWNEDKQGFIMEEGHDEYGIPKDMIIGLGDLIQGSNVWARYTLTQEKFDTLVSKASDTAKEAALTVSGLSKAPAFGETDYGKYYFSLYEAVADETGDKSMRPDVIWGMPYEIFADNVAVLPAEDAEGFADEVKKVIDEFEKLDTNSVRTLESAYGDTMAAYHTAVSAALAQKEDGSEDKAADFYQRVMALPDALIIDQSSLQEVKALRDIYDNMEDDQQALIDWTGKTVLQKLQAAEAVLIPPAAGGDTPKTMTVRYTLLGAPNDGEDGTVHTLRANNLETWYSTTQTFNATSLTAEEVFRTIMGKAGIAWRGNSTNQFGTLYVSGIKSPLTDDWMDEFTTTRNSGWMYTVNGSHPNVGMSNYTLRDGDVFVVHYTDDYTKEESADAFGNEPFKPEEEVKDVVTGGGTATGEPVTTTTPTEVTVSGSTATATVTKENVTETLKQATENKASEIVLQVSESDTKGAATVKVQLDTATVKDIVEDTTASLTVKTENGTVSLDQEVLKTVAAEAAGSTVTLEIVGVKAPTAAHKEAAGENGHVIQLVIKSGNKTISLFNEGKATVTVEIPTKLDGKKVAAIHIGDDGKIEHLKGQEVTVGGKKHYRFDTPHFSTFALVDADEIGLEVEEETMTADEVKALLADLTPVARSSKTAKKNVKVTVKLDKADKAIIEELEAEGFTVKYNFYRSTKKASKYKSRLIKDTTTYTQTGGKKGIKYFYKVRVQVYDAEGKLIARTALKQCRYATRTWSK